MISETYEGGRSIDYSPLMFNFMQLRERIHRFFWNNHWSGSAEVRKAFDFLKTELASLDLTPETATDERLWQNTPKMVELLREVFAAVDELQDRLNFSPRAEDEGVFREEVLALAKNFDRIAGFMSSRHLTLEHHFLESIVRAENGRKVLTGKSWTPTSDVVIAAAEARDELYEAWSSVNLRTYLRLADSVTTSPVYRSCLEVAPLHPRSEPLGDEAIQALRDELETELLWLEANDK